jgi:gliding motility-associated protein GldM
MAGGKETPRQRMIGLMYLVLTALLALQVSNAVLEKFVFIDESLKHSVHVSRDASNNVLKAMKTAVEKEGNRPMDMAYLTKANQVKEAVTNMLSEMDKMREELIAHTGGRDEKGELKNGKDYDMVMNFMIGAEGSKSGKAYKLQADLNDFAKKIAQMDTALEKQVETRIAFDAKEMAMYKNNPDHASKDFANINFGNTPLVAALAIMSEMETQVARYEAKAMEVLSKKVGQVDVKFDKILAMATAESNIVAAGTMYKAKLFLSASASNIVPRMSSTAGPVKIENGVGSIEFKASGSAYDKDGNEKKSWKGAITIKTTRGTDTTFNVEQEYTVAKPVIQIQGNAVKSLYLNCGNELSVQVPALGAAYDPAFSAGGAEVIRQAKKGDIIVVPNQAKVALTVSSGGSVIGVENFAVRLLPKPDIEIFSGSRAIDQKQGGPCPRSLTAKAIAEQSIRDAIPKDARYKVVGWEVSLARGKRLMGATKKVAAETVDITDFASSAQPGDRLIIEVKGVKRMNFKGVTEDVRIGAAIYQYPIN